MYYFMYEEICERIELNEKMCLIYMAKNLGLKMRKKTIIWENSKTVNSNLILLSVLCLFDFYEKKLILPHEFVHVGKYINIKSSNMAK